MKMSPHHKKFLSNTWCYIKHAFNKTKRNACLMAIKNEKKANGRHLSGRKQGGFNIEAAHAALPHKYERRYLLSAQQCNLIKKLSDRSRCIKELNAPLRARSRVRSNGRSRINHKGFLAKTKCLLSHPFNKEKRDQCNRLAAEKENREKKANAQVVIVNSRHNSKKNDSKSKDKKDKKDKKGNNDDEKDKKGKKDKKNKTDKNDEKEEKGKKDKKDKKDKKHLGLYF